MKKINILTSLLCGILLLASSSLAENLICRGTNRPLLEKAMEKVIKEKLKNANIQVKKVMVKLMIVGSRSKDSIDLSSMKDGITIGSDPFSVASSALYPDPEECTLNVKEHILVVNKENKVSRSVRNITLKGHLLMGGRGFDDSKGD